jgi:hypothetical protein
MNQNTFRLTRAPRDRHTQRRHVDLLRVCSAQCLQHDQPSLRAPGAR